MAVLQGRLLGMAATMRAWVPELRGVGSRLRPLVPEWDSRERLREKGTEDLATYLYDSLDALIVEGLVSTVARFERAARASQNRASRIGGGGELDRLWREIDPEAPAVPGPGTGTEA